MKPSHGDDLRSLGRLSEPALHVMVALADGPKHGYAIATDIESTTGTRPGPGTLYGALSRLVARRWIEPLGKDGRRRPYQLTGRGTKVLRAQLASIEAVAKVGWSRLATP
jgi:DNA-binding PadR family transcriptional regulator